MPHLFVDERPPAVHVAALGDLGGAIGAALLASGQKPDHRRKRPARGAKGGASSRGSSRQARGRASR